MGPAPQLGYASAEAWRVEWMVMASSMNTERLSVPGSVVMCGWAIGLVPVQADSRRLFAPLSLTDH
jgi:hypothetical protein